MSYEKLNGEPWQFDGGMSEDPVVQENRAELERIGGRVRELRRGQAALIEALKESESRLDSLWLIHEEEDLVEQFGDDLLGDLQQSALHHIERAEEHLGEAVEHQAKNHQREAEEHARLAQVHADTARAQAVMAASIR